MQLFIVEQDLLSKWIGVYFEYVEQESAGLQPVFQHIFIFQELQMKTEIKTLTFRHDIFIRSEVSISISV